MTKPKSWKEVFYPHKFFGYIEYCASTAKYFGYPFFCWNGIIYPSNLKSMNEKVMLAEDLTKEDAHEL